MLGSSNTGSPVNKAKREVRSLFAPMKPTSLRSPLVSTHQTGRSSQPPQAKLSKREFVKQLEAQYNQLISIEDGRLTFKLSDGAKAFDVSKVWSGGDLLALTLFLLQQNGLTKTAIRFAVRRLADKIGYAKTYFRNGEAVSRKELQAQLRADREAVYK